MLDAIKNGRARGNGADGGRALQGKDAQDVAAFVAKAVDQTVPSAPSRPSGRPARHGCRKSDRRGIRKVRDFRRRFP